ncbi:putative carbonic anhydrase protein [Eutypa lata UCREL1]|uniref:Carbonic anhydrase n=1 Tax=Eutypa lata (strain UCR-EL1) TaxID=1287681 RepID=M7SUQ6_EUTLA|nr:putative carbonic anhydrase protein [Eutypa lata UCREL1]
MAESEIQKNIREKNAEYASTFTQGDLALPPAKKYLVLTCMDARIDPASALGIALGDAHVVRNAGASARDALRSLVHTGCGMLTFTNDDVRKLVAENLGPSAAAAVGEIQDFLPFGDLEAEVRRDVEFLVASPLIPEYVVLSGWVYEVETGKVRRVV